MTGTSIFTNGHFNIIILLIVNLKIITDFNKINIFQCHRLAKIKAWSYKKKNCKKIKAHKKSVQNNSYLQKVSVNSRLKDTWIIGQRKAFYRHRT